jgi:hypothetical protein
MVRRKHKCENRMTISLETVVLSHIKHLSAEKINHFDILGGLEMLTKHTTPARRAARQRHRLPICDHFAAIASKPSSGVCT